MKNLFLVMVGLMLCQTVFAAAQGEASRRSQELKTLNFPDMIVYKPNKTSASVTVFTDLGCSYCHKLHDNIPALLKAGIEIRYLAFPRQGLKSSAYNKMVSIVCSKDPKAALSRAMQGETPVPATCKNTVKDQFLLGRQWGIRGTPTLVYSDGTMWDGYLPPDKLAREAISHRGT